MQVAARQEAQDARQETLCKRLVRPKQKVVVQERDRGHFWQEASLREVVAAEVATMEEAARHHQVKLVQAEVAFWGA